MKNCVNGGAIKNHATKGMIMFYSQDLKSVIKNLPILYMRYTRYAHNGKNVNTVGEMNPSHTICHIWYAKNGMNSFRV